MKGVRGGEMEGRGSTYPGPTFSLVYATPLLQHQAQFGLIPARGPHHRILVVLTSDNYIE